MTKRTSNDAEPLLTPKEAAALLHVATRTLQRMAERGDIRAVKLPSGHRRYRVSDVENILHREDYAA